MRRGQSAESFASKIRYEKWASKRGLKKSTGKISPLRLINKRPNWDRFGPSWEDHTHMWIKDSKAVLYTTEPYYVSEKEEREIRDLAESLGLQYTVLAPGPDSLWVPNTTWFVAMARPGYEYLLTLPNRRRAAIEHTKRKNS